MSQSAAAKSSKPSSRERREVHCCQRMTDGNGNPTKPCRRNPLWNITYVGHMCQYHFELYMTSHTIDPKDIQRLSDREVDFITRTEAIQGLH